MGVDRECDVKHAVEERVCVDALRVVRAGDVGSPRPAEHNHAHPCTQQLAELSAGDIKIAATVAAAFRVEGAVDLFWRVEAQLGRELGSLHAVPVRKNLVVPVLPLSINFHVAIPVAVGKSTASEKARIYPVEVEKYTRDRRKHELCDS